MQAGAEADSKPLQPAIDLQDDLSYGPFWRAKTDLMEWLELQDVIADRALCDKYWPQAAEPVEVCVVRAWCRV